MIARRVTKMQSDLLALEDSPNGESPAQPSGISLQADPLIDEYRQAKRRAMALTLCEYATTPAAWLIANRLAQSWGLSCTALGTPKPADPDGERRRGVQNPTWT